MSSCGARMKPIGLTLNNPRTNLHTGRTGGELMVVHQCLGCGKISCNRIAGDDNSHAVICLLDDSNSLDEETITRLACQGIRLLTQEDKGEILTALYGYEYQKYFE
jgi:hypothetical protein